MNNMKKLFLTACVGLFFTCAAMGSGVNDAAPSAISSTSAVEAGSTQVPPVPSIDIRQYNWGQNLELFADLIIKLELLGSYSQWYKKSMAGYEYGQFPSFAQKMKAELENMQKEVLALAQKYLKQGHNPLQSQYFGKVHANTFPPILEFWPADDKQSIIYQMGNQENYMQAMQQKPILTQQVPN